MACNHADGNKTKLVSWISGLDGLRAVASNRILFTASEHVLSMVCYTFVAAMMVLLACHPWNATIH